MIHRTQNFISHFFWKGTRKRVTRPADDVTPAFQLSYIRSGPRTTTPVVVIPGGPGLGSIMPYRTLRRIADSGGLDIILVEHRGVGFSRNTVDGDPLQHDSIWVTAVLDDIAAVLDHEGAEQAFIAGSSYGSYLAAAFGARYPDRVAGMLLDSALQSVGDLANERNRIRALFTDGDTEIHEGIDRLRASGQVSERLLLDIARAAYELGGQPFLQRILALRAAHRSSLSWWALTRYATRDENITRIPGFFEFDIAGAIGFRELNYGAKPDGKPLDPALTYAPLQASFPVFMGEPYDLPAEVASFSWPLVCLVGARDVRTPPSVAQRVADSAPNAVSITIANGHSALDTHPLAFLNAVRLLVRGETHRIPGLGQRFSVLPKRGLGARLPQLLIALSRAEAAVSRLTRRSRRAV